MPGNGMNTTPLHSTPGHCVFEEAERMGRAAGWNKSMKSPYSGRNGFGSVPRSITPTGHRHRSTSGGRRRGSLATADGRIITTAAQRAVEQARGSVLGLVETPTVQNPTNPGFAPPKATFDFAAYQPPPPAVEPLSTPVADEKGMETPSFTSPVSCGTGMSRLASLGERALSQGMTPTKERAGRVSTATAGADPLSAFKVRMESMGYGHTLPASVDTPCAEPADAMDEQQAEEPAPNSPGDVPMSPTDAPMCQSARKSVTFRSPLTDIKNRANPDYAQKASPSLSPAVTLTTPIVRLSFATETSLERHESEMEDSVCLFRRESLETTADAAAQNPFAFHPTSITPLKPRRRETIVFDRDDSDFGPCEPPGAAAPDAADAAEDLDALSYRDLQLLAKSLGVPCKGKKPLLLRAIQKAQAAGGAAPPREKEERYYSDDQGTAEGLEAMSYRELQIQAKSLGLNASGTKAALMSRIADATM